MEENRSGVGLAEPEVVSPAEEHELPLVVSTPHKKGPRHAAPRKKSFWVKRTLAGIGISLLALILAVLVAAMVIFYTPWFTGLRDQYILMTYHTSNPWLCTWFFSAETIDSVLQGNSMGDLLDPTPTPPSDEPNTPEEPSTPEEPEVPEVPSQPDPPTFKDATVEDFVGTVIYKDDEVQITEFSGKTAKGKYTARMIQILDPSRVTLGLTAQVGSLKDGVAGRGQTILEMCADNDALCGINAGGFVDEGGVGSGGIPLGTVVKDGVVTVYSEDKTNGKVREHTIIGFDRDNQLVMGNFTEDQIAELNIRDAMSWRSPAALILNGEKATFTGLAGGYDPRSAIGQRADGTVLLLVVDGSVRRSVDGANYALLADIMEAYGAENAANLDGGTSSVMALNGKVINQNCNPAISHRGRYLATSWLVKNTATADTTPTTTTTGSTPTTTKTSGTIYTTTTVSE